MEKKIDLPKYWRYFTLGFMALSWIILIHIMKKPNWILIPIFIAYLIINAIIFNSYYLGILGNYYYRTRHFDKAYDIYEKAIKKNTRNVMAIYNYAIRLLQDGNGSEALNLFNRALNINTKIIMDKNILLAISSCYWTMGNIDKAIETLESLKSKYSYVNAHVLTTLGYFYFLKKDYEKAAEYTNNAIEDNPEHAPAWDNFGQIYFAEKNFEKAKECFEKALSYKNNMVDSLYYLGEVYENENNIEKAAKYFEKAANCNITSLNTVTKEQVQQKYKKYQNLF